MFDSSFCRADAFIPSNAAWFSIVVTLDGILLGKSGTMTGGVSGGMEARSHKWDDRAVDGELQLRCHVFCIGDLAVKLNCPTIQTSDATWLW